MSSSFVVPHHTSSGYPSSRIVIVGNLDGPGSPEVLLVEEMHKETGEKILRLPGGEAHKNEDPRDCAHRERIEETGIKQSDLDTPLIDGYVRKGKMYDVYVFYCGVGKRIALRRLQPTDEKTLGVRWVNLTEILYKESSYVSSDGLRLQPSHLNHLRELITKRPRYIEELALCVAVSKETKSAS